MLFLSHACPESWLPEGWWARVGTGVGKKEVGWEESTRGTVLVAADELRKVPLLRDPYSGELEMLRRSSDMGDAARCPYTLPHASVYLPSQRPHLLSSTFLSVCWADALLTLVLPQETSLPASVPLSLHSGNHTHRDRPAASVSAGRASPVPRAERLHSVRRTSF